MNCAFLENTRRNAIIIAARGWIGTPYSHQASLRGVGCDCLGLVRGVWREVIGREPEVPQAYTPSWAEGSGREQLLEAALRHFTPRTGNACIPGDVLLFRWRVNLPAKHLAIATSEATMVHAHDGACVCEVTISPWWRRHIAHVFAFPDTAASARSGA